MTIREASDILLSLKCGACGEEKKSKLAICATCYGKLPHSVRQNLYKTLGKGFEEAYAESLAWLKETRKAKRTAAAAQGTFGGSSEYPD